MSTKPETTIRPGCFAVVESLNRNRVLLGKRAVGEIARDLWILPGGGIDFMEPHRTSLIRELIEEAGVHATVEDLIGVREIILPPNKHRLMLFYRCHAKANEYSDTDELTEVKFFTRDELKTIEPQMSDLAREVLQQSGWL